MSENETLADIRKESEARFRELLEKHVDGLGYIQAMQQFNQVFDRIEAAKKREFGNAAAMRSALETVRKYVKETTPDKVMLGVIEVWCDAALAAPPRNCDRFNSGDCNRDVVDASLAWDKFCAEHYPPGTPVVPKTPYTFWSWVFAQANESEVKS